jgi:molybdate transport system substrate-binding protein
VKRVLVLAILLVTACGAAPATGPTAGPVSGQLTVLAAASLTDAFRDEGQAFAKEHPGTEVQFSFAGSSALATQIQQGAPADVFASADQQNLDKVAGQVAGAQRVFAANRLQIAVAPGNPRHINSLAGLVRSDVVTVLCAPQVPCGAYALQAFKKAGVVVTPRSQETDVRAVLTKIATGEADAGVVYATDVKSSGGKVEGVDIPDAQNVAATYPVAVLKGASNPHAAEAFIDFLVSTGGQAILTRYGFQKP